jgi:hypothetical protein
MWNPEILPMRQIHDNQYGNLQASIPLVLDRATVAISAHVAPEVR